MRWSGLCLALVLATTSAHADTEQSPTPMTELTDEELLRMAEEDLAQVRLPPHFPDGSTEPVPEISGARRTLAIVSSATVGLFARGVGSYLVGRSRTARRLALVGAIGLGGVIAGGVPVGVSGGYPPTLPLMPVLLVGAGMFFTTWWADIAVAAGISRIGTVRTQSPWSIELATLYLSDPYRQTGLARLGGNIEIGRLQLGASGLIDAENEIRTGEVETRLRLYGAPATGEAVADGSRLLVRSALRSHEDDGDRVTIMTAEVEVIGRYDLRRLDRVLGGTFVQVSTGIGVERVGYSGGHDNGSVLLGTFGWGVYLGNRGELQLFYDHRRDSMVGGLAAGRAAGFVGSLGGSLDWLVDPRWLVHFEIDVGNAWLTTLGLRYRGGL